MGVTKDFIMATIADAMTPTFRRPMEDLIYETLDRRQIPTRTDFKELRDLVNNLRGQVSGSVQSVRALHSKLEEVEDQGESEDLAEHLKPLEDKLQQLELSLKRLEDNELISRLERMEKALQNQSALVQRIDELEANQKIIVQAIKGK